MGLLDTLKGLFAGAPADEPQVQPTADTPAEDVPTEEVPAGTSE